MKKEPARPELAKKILGELRKHPNGIWVRKLARILNEPVTTIHKYVNREDYVGKFVEIESRPQELGGHTMIKIKGKK